MHGSGVKKDDFQNSQTGNNLSSAGANSASSLYGTLEPELSSMAANPQGINPTDMAKIQTSNMQTAGGTNAGAVGSGALLAARTKNAGTADAAIAKSGESAQQTLSKANLATQNEDQEIKREQQQSGLKGEENLYGTGVSEALGGLNSSNTALHNAAEVQPFWQKLLMQGIQSGGQVAGSYLQGAGAGGG